MIIKYQELLAQYPFLTVLQYNNTEFVGVVQNQDTAFTGLYDIGVCTTQLEKTQFLAMADQWWWESNRMIPINIFMKHDWAAFNHTLKTFNTKNTEILCGHVVNLNFIHQKRIKRRSIQLVKKAK